MTCCDCSSSLLETDFRGIKIQECPQCHGRWFGRGELNKAKDHTDEDLRWLDFDAFVQRLEQKKLSSEGKICPQCIVTMPSLVYQKSNITIEKCVQCQGVWLRHGEFEKMIKYLEDLIASEPASDYVKDTLKQFLEIVQGKEGVVEEAKDFLVVLKLLRLRAAIEHPAAAKALNKLYEYLPFL